MSDTETKTIVQGISLPGALGLLFIGLKLTGHIDWSWWYVTLPLWGPALMVIVITGLFFLTILFLAAFNAYVTDPIRDKYFSKKKNG